MSRPFPSIAVLCCALALAACNPSGTQTKAGSGDGPTNSAGSSNQPGVAKNGNPAAE